MQEVLAVKMLKKTFPVSLLALCVWLIIASQSGHKSIGSEPAEAQDDWLLTIARKGDASAQFDLGLMYYTGW